MTTSDLNVIDAIEAWPELVERLHGHQLAVFLDYDGTLVPIAERPDLARLTADQREQLADTARAWPTFVLSGRGREDVARLIDVPAIRCMGAHGLDIGPDSPPELQHQLASVPPMIDAAAAELSPLVATVPNLILENKTVALAVHYRMVPPSRFDAIEMAVDQVAARMPSLQKTTGKMVFELRPDLDWNKGSALLWLLSTLPAGPDVIPIFIGDDMTDEDALEAVAERGIGIVVAAQRPTAARYTVRDVADVYDVLGRIRSLRV